MVKEITWTQRLVPVWRKNLAALLLVAGLALTVVRGQHPRGPGNDPCWFGNFAACQAGCMQFMGSGGHCRGFHCVCSQPQPIFPGGPGPMLPGAPPPMGPLPGRMSEDPREVPCMTGAHRCEQFCMENTGYGGQCHGTACKCAAFNKGYNVWYS